MPSRLPIIVLTSVALAALGVGSASRAADQTPTVMFLLDGSGSMWGPLGNERRAKFEISRDLLAQTPG